jgi:exodeoxyribonuclease V alpha subunit
MMEASFAHFLLTGWPASAYLAGGFVKGVGPVLAKKLVGRFGAEVLGVIGNSPAGLETVDGIGPKRRERIARAWQDGMQIREIMLFLHSHPHP